MKIIATSLILGLLLNVCSGTTPTSTSQSSAISSSSLNSTATKVFSAANQTDAAIWNTFALTTPGTTSVLAADVVFGAGSENTTSYVYGMFVASSVITKIYKRTLNATIVGWGNDTTETSVTSDNTITATIPATSKTYATAPGYLGILSQGSDAATPANNQVYLNIVSGTTATQIKLTSTSDVIAANVKSGETCTTTTFDLGNVWYDISAGAFFYTYWKKVDTTAAASADGTCGAAGTTAYTIYVGGHYVNGTAYWTAPGLSITPSTAANAVSYLMGGSDNWINSSTIYVVYKDAAMTTPTTYSSKTTKATTTTTAGTFSSLVADVTAAASVIGKTFIPIGVWASDYTYGIAVSNKTATAAGASPSTFTYVIGNYLNGSTTYTDSGLSYSSAATPGATALVGWKLTTGYTLAASWTTATASTYAWTYGTFYANGTTNSTAATLGSLEGPVNFYEDGNGTMWVGWQDVDTANTQSTYAGYLAKFQGQLNDDSDGANILTTLSSLIVVFLALTFIF